MALRHRSDSFVLALVPNRKATLELIQRYHSTMKAYICSLVPTAELDEVEPVFMTFSSRFIRNSLPEINIEEGAAIPVACARLLAGIWREWNSLDDTQRKEGEPVEPLGKMLKNCSYMQRSILMLHIGFDLSMKNCSIIMHEKEEKLAEEFQNAIEKLTKISENKKPESIQEDIRRTLRRIPKYKSDVKLKDKLKTRI